MKQQGERLIARLPPDRVSTFLSGALARGGRIVTVNPVSYSLEELFLSEVKKRGGSPVTGGLE